MKKNTRDYGKGHPRFAEGGPIQTDRKEDKPIPIGPGSGIPGTWSDWDQASGASGNEGEDSRPDRPIRRSGYPR